MSLRPKQRIIHCAEEVTTAQLFKAIEDASRYGLHKRNKIYIIMRKSIEKQFLSGSVNINTLNMNRITGVFGHEVSVFEDVLFDAILGPDKLFMAISDRSYYKALCDMLRGNIMCIAAIK